jgi:hypothetical protein
MEFFYNNWLWLNQGLKSAVYVIAIIIWKYFLH